MKKTDKTALTAAIFAAAMGAAAVSGGQAEAADVNAGLNAVESQLSAFAPVYGPSPDFEYTVPVIETTATTTPVTTVPDPVYGPPWMMTTVAETTAVEELETLQDVYGPPVTMELPTTPEPTEPVITTAAEDPTMPEFQDVYGPPPITEPTTTSVEDLTQFATVYGPPWTITGDLNKDGSVDVFDMPIMRKAVLDGTPFLYPNAHFDVNKDTQISVADLVALSQYLTGQRDDLDGPVKENKINVIYDKETEEPTNPDLIPQPKYGPVYAGDIEEPTESIEDLWGLSTAYGPPSFFGLDDN